jgi:hypothetical protein
MRDYVALGKLGGRPRRPSWAEIQEGRKQSLTVCKSKIIKQNKREKGEKLKSVDFSASLIQGLFNLEYQEQKPTEKLEDHRSGREGSK